MQTHTLESIYSVTVKKEALSLILLLLLLLTVMVVVLLTLCSLSTHAVHRFFSLISPMLYRLRLKYKTSAIKSVEKRGDEEVERVNQYVVAAISKI